MIARLRRQFTSGTLPLGSRIATETELVEQLGVARNTVREAVRTVAHTGLSDIRHGSGSYVRATSDLAGMVRIRFEKAHTDDIADVRGALEVLAACLACAAAHRRTRGGWTRYSLSGKRPGRKGTGSPSYTPTSLFTWPSSPRHNTVLAQLHADLGEVIRDSLLDHLGEELRLEQFQDHTRLVEAIHDRNSDRAAYEFDPSVGAGTKRRVTGASGERCRRHSGRARRRARLRVGLGESAGEPELAVGDGAGKYGEQGGVGPRRWNSESTAAVRAAGSA